MIKQCVHQSAIGIACGRVHHHAFRFIHHKQLAVLIDYFHGDILWLDVKLHRVGNNYLNAVTVMQLIIFRYFFASNCDATVLDKLLHSGTSKTCILRRQKSVDTLACLLGSGNKIKLCHFRL